MFLIELDRDTINILNFVGYFLDENRLTDKLITYNFSTTAKTTAYFRYIRVGNLKYRMSTFGGKIQEIPQISVDRFDGVNFESEAYFLSHCHTDHMKGLNDGHFQNMVIKENKFLYASQISCIIIKNMFIQLKNNVRELFLYKPTTVILKTKSISVIPIPAGHCPGSVMFLFENDKRILYTGDYRIHSDDIKKIKPFYDCFGRIKNIDKIYLDTTFFLEDYYMFPKRDDSIEEVCSIVKEWIDRGDNFILHLKTSANYGYEYIFAKIYEKTGMPIHVKEKIYTFYSLIPEMDKSVTTDSSATQIHCSCGLGYQWLCYDFQNGIVKTMKVSALRWTQEDLDDGVSCIDNGVHYVCYSTHASYKEGVELIRFLKPKAIEACVQQENPCDNNKMMKLIEKHLMELSLQTESKEEPKLFDVSGMVSKKRKTELKSPLYDSGLYDSSPEYCWKSDNSLSTNTKNMHESENVKKCEYVEQGLINYTQKCDDGSGEHDVLLDIIGTTSSSCTTNSNSMKTARVDRDDDDVIYTIINS